MTSRGREGQPVLTEAPLERAFLVGVERRDRPSLWPAQESLVELEQLVESAGAQVVGSALQRLERPHADTFIGRGKVEEIAARHGELEYTMVVFDEELSPSHQRNLERMLKVKVLDRPAIILDIFAQRARTREGRLQVEVAQLQYQLPRLAGLWQHLERLGGGIGTRGPGETQLETDRQLVRHRLVRLQRELEKVRQQRSLYRRRRRLERVPIVALVGYTNAGKSTLLNALTGAMATVEDRPFATLDPTARRLRLPGPSPDGSWSAVAPSPDQTVLLMDTVGFIHKLPPMLVAAFRATLEELEEADLLLHVVDITHSYAAEQSETVDTVLRELGLADKPRLRAFNKVDLLPGFDPSGPWPEEVSPGRGPVGGEGLLISAATGWGLEQLREELARRLAGLGPPAGGRARQVPLVAAR